MRASHIVNYGQGKTASWFARFATEGNCVPTHWMVGETLQTKETVCFESNDGRVVEHA